MSTDAERENSTEEALDPENRVGSRGALRTDEETLLSVAKPEAAKIALREWDDSFKHVRNTTEQWRVNHARSQGFVGVSLIKKQDKSEAHIPLNAKKSVSGLNKAARLKRRLRSVMLADPPVADATPAGDDDQARDAAKTSTRVLHDQCSESGLDYGLAIGDAFDLAGDYGSGFVRFWVDESGGGLVPKQVEVSPHAIDSSDPYPKDEAGNDLPGDPILRYVTEAGQFTNERTEAEKVWQPKLKREILTGKHVRFIPFNVRDIWEADGLMVGAAVPLGTLKAQFPEIKTWAPERVAKLVGKRPQHFNDLLPAGQKSAGMDPSSDDTMVFVLSRYHIQSGKYPYGCYLICAGEDECLYRQDWYDHGHCEQLDIPVTQIKQLTDEDNAYGAGVMEGLGPGNESRAQLLGSMFEHLDRFNNRKIFASMISSLAGNPQLFQAPTGTPIPILPGTEPIYEQIPDFPRQTEKMLEFINADMDDESGLQQVGQGLNPASVKSGLHANAIREQVQMGLTDLRENMERGIVRGWRIMLQQDRAFFTEPQILKFTTPDGRYQLKRWSSTDLGSTRDVRIQRGSFTQLSPTHKAELARGYAEMGLLTRQDLEHVLESNVGGTFGLQDNAHRNRVRGQIAKWEDGPPPGWQPPQPLIDPGTGQEVPQPDPAITNIWDQRAVDTQPDVATLRVYELAKAMSGTAYTRWPEPWRAGLVQAYTAARQAAQIVDAEQLQKLQQELQAAQQKAMEADNQAAAAKKAPSFGFSVKGADLDPTQTQAMAAQLGLELPASTMTPLDPRENLALEREKLNVDIQKHTISEQAKVQTARVAAAKEGELAHAASSAKPSPSTGGVNVIMPTILPQTTAEGVEQHLREVEGQLVEMRDTVAKVAGDLAKANQDIATRPKAFKIVRGKDGKVAGAVAVEQKAMG